MRKRMKMTAVIMSVIMMASPVLACAQEINANGTIIPIEAVNGTDQSQETQEYIVLAHDDEGIELAESVGQQTDEATNNLTDNDVTVVEMTAEEAEELQEDDSILLVEENIMLEGSDYDPEEFEQEPLNLSPEEEREFKMMLKAQRDDNPLIAA
ncbi:MAG: hypothetical protein IKR58_05565 [Lachnospiraceae bacterium]|nr:hypothetical protein [Lachnospiraceae bacterium]